MSDNQLAREMYPKALSENPIYKSRTEPLTIGKLALETIEGLDILSRYQPAAGAPITHAAKVLIQALQDELDIAKDVIVSLKDSLDTAESTFADTCDCGECDACEKAEGYRANVKSAEQEIERIKLTRV